MCSTLIGTEMFAKACIVARACVDALLCKKDEFPLLNQFPSMTGVRDGILVRVRGMVQDTLDSVLKHQKLGEYDLRYRDGNEGIYNPESLIFSDSYYDVDRYTIVSVPGCVDPCVVLPLSHVYKPDGTFVDVPKDLLCSSAVVCEDPPMLVPIDEREVFVESNPVDPHPLPVGLLSDVSKPRFSLIANLCRGAEDVPASLKLHQIIDMFGILSNFEESQTTELPRVNFSMQVLSVLPVQSDAPMSCPTDLLQGRDQLKSLLMKICKNDALAAEYLLLQLVSMRVDGNPAVPTMGSWTLNLMNSKSINLEMLISFLKKIIKKPIVDLACTIENLSQYKFYPERLDCNDFTSPGVLQLAKNTLTVLDERVMQEGNVNALNVLAITKAVQDQDLMGIFGGQIVKFPMQYKFLILTDRQSIFSSCNPPQGIDGNVPYVTLPLVPSCQETDDRIGVVTDIQALAMQQYIEYCESLISKVEIPEEIVKVFENDWVETRRINPNIPTEDIHVWATLLRSVPASFGDTSVSLDHWTNIMNCEQQRRNRISPKTENSQVFLNSNERVAVVGA